MHRYLLIHFLTFEIFDSLHWLHQIVLLFVEMVKFGWLFLFKSGWTLISISQLFIALVISLTHSESTILPSIFGHKLIWKTCHAGHLWIGQILLPVHLSIRQILIALLRICSLAPQIETPWESGFRFLWLWPYHGRFSRRLYCRGRFAHVIALRTRRTFLFSVLFRFMLSFQCIWRTVMSFGRRGHTYRISLSSLSSWLLYDFHVLIAKSNRRWPLCWSVE